MDDIELHKMLMQLRETPLFHEIVVESAEKYERHQLEIRAAEEKRYFLANSLTLADPWIIQVVEGLWQLHNTEDDICYLSSYDFVDIWERYEHKTSKYKQY